MLVLKLNHVSKRGHKYDRKTNIFRIVETAQLWLQYMGYKGVRIGAEIWYRPKHESWFQI